MIANIFIKGLLTGLLVSLPLGPMGILVVQRTANRDLKSGFYTGLGVAVTDSIWALIAGFSVTYIITFLRANQMLIQIVAAVALFALGLYIFFSHPLKALRKYRRSATKPYQLFFSSILIAFSNPAAIFIYIVVFASINVVFDIHNPASPLLFTLGFLMGATSWWLILSYSINHFRHHLNLHRLWWLNKISGIAIMLFVVISTIFIILKGSPNL